MQITVKSSFIWTSLLTLIVVSYNACSVVSQPTAGASFHSSTTFDHTGITTGCTVCHSTGQKFADLPATNHPYIKQNDCNTCHVTSAWVTGVNPHTTLGFQTPATCIECHGASGPALTVPSGAKGTPAIVSNLTPTGGYFDHSANGGTGDCGNCHLWTPSKIGVAFSNGVFNHVPQPPACLTCHTAAQQPMGSVNGFNHQTSASGVDCVGCHTAAPSNVGRSWQTATFSHSPTPSTCANCHAQDSLFNSMQNVITNQMNHTYSGMPTDCVSCHLNTSSASGFASWIAEGVANGSSTSSSSYGIFHANVPNVTTCVVCHANERPTTPVFGFLHSSDGLGDCYACHRGTTSNIGKTWSGGADTPE